MKQVLIFFFVPFEAKTTAPFFCPKPDTLRHIRNVWLTTIRYVSALLLLFTLSYGFLAPTIILTLCTIHILLEYNFFLRPLETVWTQKYKKTNTHRNYKILLPSNSKLVRKLILLQLVSC